MDETKRLKQITDPKILSDIKIQVNDLVPRDQVIIFNPTALKETIVTDIFKESAKPKSVLKTEDEVLQEDLGTAWYQHTARMTREELFKAFEREAQMRGQLSDTLSRTKSELADAKTNARLRESERDQAKRKADEFAKKAKSLENRRIYIVGSAMQHIIYASERMGLPQRRVVPILTSGVEGVRKLYGVTPDALDVRLVRSWRQGRYAAEIEDRFRSIGIDLRTQVGYAPDAHYDMVDEGTYADAIIREHEYRKPSEPPTLDPGSEFYVSMGDPFRRSGPYRVSQTSLSRDNIGSSQVQIEGVLPRRDERGRFTS